MDEDIDFLLQAYEQEKKSLTERIAEDLQYEEYLSAHIHYNALNLLKSKISIILQLKNPYENEIRHYTGNIEYRTQLMELYPGDEALTDRLNRSIARDKEKIEEITATADQLKLKPPENMIDPAISNLLARKLKFIKLHLKRKDKFFIRLTCSKNSLRFRMSVIKRRTHAQFPPEYVFEKLHVLGFVSRSSSKQLILIIQGNYEHLFNQSRIILSKIIFDILSPYDFKDECCLETG